MEIPDVQPYSPDLNLRLPMRLPIFLHLDSYLERETLTSCMGKMETKKAPILVL